MTKTKRSLPFLAFLVVVSPHLAGGFSTSPRTCRQQRQNIQRNVALRSKLFGPEDDFNDEIGRVEPFGGENAGKDLANDFYQELRKRDETPKAQLPNSGDRPGSPRSEKLSASNSAARGENSDPTEAANPLPKKKFTGQNEFFQGQRAMASSAGGQSRTPREMMMEREYQLVGRAERGIAAQAVVAVLALVFYIYVGLSGGIVSGPDAQMEDFGGDDEIPFEQLMPVQRDREVSVWL